jgi:flagellar biosynthesis chaperone FliJ
MTMPSENTPPESEKSSSEDTSSIIKSSEERSEEGTTQVVTLSEVMAQLDKGWWEMAKAHSLLYFYLLDPSGKRPPSSSQKHQIQLYLSQLVEKISKYRGQLRRWSSSSNDSSTK